jgi:hypothetical protein
MSQLTKYIYEVQNDNGSYTRYVYDTLNELINKWGTNQYNIQVECVNDDGYINTYYTGVTEEQFYKLYKEYDIPMIHYVNNVEKLYFQSNKYSEYSEIYNKKNIHNVSEYVKMRIGDIKLENLENVNRIIVIFKNEMKKLEEIMIFEKHFL